MTKPSEEFSTIEDFEHLSKYDRAKGRQAAWVGFGLFNGIAITSEIMIVGVVEPLQHDPTFGKFAIASFLGICASVVGFCYQGNVAEIAENQLTD